MVRIHFQRAKCIGCNGCVEAAPDRWRISRKDGKSNLIGSSENKGFFVALAEDAELEQNKQAAANCPVRIIRVEQA
jgi:ferredoxin